MILKIAGSVILILATSLIGFSMAADCSRRPKMLRELQALLQMFQNEISYLSNLLADSFQRIDSLSKTEVSVIFRDAAKYLKSDGMTADLAWGRAVEENYAKLALNKEDRGILVTFGEMLGASDLEGQISNINMLASQLKLQEIKAEEMRKKNEKMYRSLGVLSGLAITIILF